MKNNNKSLSLIQNYIDTEYVSAKQREKERFEIKKLRNT